MGYFLSPGLSENLILLSSQVNGSLIEDKIIGQNLRCQNPGGVSHWLWEFKILKEEFEGVIFFFQSHVDNLIFFFYLSKIFIYFY